MQSTETLSGTKEKHTHDMDLALKEGISTEAIWFGFNEEVTIATRHKTPVGKAPSVVTVITAEEIKNLGYRTFVEILRTVPGFEILKTGAFGDTIPAVRGIAGENKVRVMLNGHLVNNPLRGGAFVTFDDFPVEGIKRIEIIRGPGSATYGENAFMGVINIITKDARDIDGVKVSSGYGSFDTYDENIIFGETYGSIGISGMVHYRQTDGFDGIVERDSQTIVDNSLSSLGFRNGYFESLPEGATVSSDTDGDGIADTYHTYPDGHIVNSKLTERVAGTEIPFDYELFDGNMLTLGLEYRYAKQTNVHFLSNVDPLTLEPLDSVQDFSDSYPQIDQATRNIWSVYLQDTWNITKALNFTLGVRHDQYSDFGGTTNPRSGLTWAFMKNASLKFLYGEAFRAPSFAEMYAIYQKNSIVRGNKDLDPETVRSYEIGLSYKFNKYVLSNVNYFYNDIKDLIVLRSTFEDTTRILSYENFGDAHVQGIEMETRVNIVKDNYVFMNYTFQNPEDNRGNDLPFVAQHKGNFGVNVHSWKYINTNLSTFVSGTRSREEGDDRNNLPAYALLNLSLIAKEFFKTMEIQGTVFNLLDKDYSDPGPISVPDDIPRPGRTFFVGLSYQF